VTAPIEMEKRARFSEAVYDRLMERLLREAEDLGRDDREIHWFPLEGGHLKISDNLDHDTAKIAYKRGDIGGDTAFEELEIAIPRNQVAAFAQLFEALGLSSLYHQAPNRRHNFRYHGVEIALKYSGAWGYHAELEIMLPPEASSADEQAAIAQIEAVAEELGIRLMTREDLAQFERDFRAAQAAP
jgi:adenylate cyclase class IV